MRDYETADPSFMAVERSHAVLAKVSSRGSSCHQLTMMANSVAIVGAGVSGLTTAVVFAEQGWRTAIFAAETGPATNSAAAAAIWYPSRHRRRQRRHLVGTFHLPGTGRTKRAAAYRRFHDRDAQLFAHG